MLDKLRRRAQATTTSLPLYRVIPGRATRTYAAVHYHASNATEDEVAAYLDEHGDDLHANRYSAAMLAASAAFATGRDELVERLLRELSSRFPDQSEPEVLWADLLLFRGQLDQALTHARRAALLDPTSTAAAARLVRLAADTHQPDAETTALSALRRFPTAPGVVWMVCKHCASPEQFQRIVATWTAALDKPNARKVEPRLSNLATAAARAGELDSAVELLSQGMLLRLEGVNPQREVAEKKLGKDAWATIDDVMEVMAGTGIPYFMSNGTALGMVRANGPLSHDNDIDLGIFAEDWDAERLVAAFNDHPMFELDGGHPQYGDPNRTKIFLRHRGGTWVDIWRFYADAGKVWNEGLLVRWGTTPFGIEHRTIKGREVPLPSDPERYLEECYGDWRTPNPRFDAFCDGPNTEVLWPEYQHFHRVRRAHRSLSKGDIPDVLAQLELAAPLVSATPSGRLLTERLAL